MKIEKEIKNLRNYLYDKDPELANGLYRFEEYFQKINIIQNETILEYFSFLRDLAKQHPEDKIIKQLLDKHIKDFPYLKETLFISNIKINFKIDSFSKYFVSIKQPQATCDFINQFQTEIDSELKNIKSLSQIRDEHNFHTDCEDCILKENIGKFNADIENYCDELDELEGILSDYRESFEILRHSCESIREIGSQARDLFIHNLMNLLTYDIFSNLQINFTELGNLNTEDILTEVNSFKKSLLEKQEFCLESNNFKNVKFYNSNRNYFRCENEDCEKIDSQMEDVFSEIEECNINLDDEFCKKALNNHDDLIDWTTGWLIELKKLSQDPKNYLINNFYIVSI